MPDQETLGTAAIANSELIGRIGRKEPGDEAESISQSLRGEERILAFTELGVIEVDRKRKLVDRDGVGEGGFQKVVSGLLIDDRLSIDLVRLFIVSEREAATLPGILTGFSADASPSAATKPAAVR